ncbi:atp-dependent rna helicase dbp5 [Ophiostoma piceae UAMH 11346]|uniref:RNA helicase n=1 Tax=Ophiostoma piceae (strain UAMH 11346) TaxID=1262450 RepID=S3CA37_OPHP1|nr:atp-dependent rna helicase dbp5 [Ophiostoma piceae UAMH 11346]
MADLASRITRPDAPADAPVADAPVGDVPVGDAAGNAVQDGGPGLIESTYDVEVKLSDLAGLTDNPLSSVSSFEELGLKKSIVDGLFALNFKKPSKIQERALPLLLSEPPRSMIAQSQSGTGKTAAFVVTILSRVDFSMPDVPQALVLAPSRELARQIESVINQIGQFCEGLKVAAAIPGAVERGAPVLANVVVGTPGTVLDMMRRDLDRTGKRQPGQAGKRRPGQAGMQLDTSQLKLLVIDEADNMLDKHGLGEQCVRVKQCLLTPIQKLLFSATFSEEVMQYAEEFAPSANQMRLRQQELTVRGISQMYMDCPSESEKYDVLCKLYGLMTIGSSVIFVKTRQSATEIQSRMQQDGHRVAALHGAYEGESRDQLLNDFRTGKSKVLITTNVMARGIDVSSVSMVINYDIPMKGMGDREPDAETYLHRIGRTGRFGRVGVSISFVHDRKSFTALADIANHYSIDLIQLSPDDWEETEKKIRQILKSSRAQADYKPGAAEGAPAENV